MYLTLITYLVFKTLHYVFLIAWYILLGISFCIAILFVIPVTLITISILITIIKLSIKINSEEIDE